MAWRRRTRSARTGGLVAPFAIRAAIAFFAVGVLVHVLVGRQVYERYENLDRYHTEFVTEALLRDRLEPLDTSAPITGTAATQLDAVVADHVLTGSLFRLKIWNPDGTVIYSDEPQLIGQTYPDQVSELEEVLAEGTQSELTTLESAENDFDGDRPNGALEVYVPLFLPGGRQVVVELYQDRTDTAEAAAAFTRTLDASLVLGLLGLYALLLPIARRAGRDMESKRSELEILLDREHETVERLEELGGMKDTFLAAVSHELRTPLTTVLGVAQMLERRTELSLEQRQRLVERLVSNAERLESLLSSLLDLDRLTRGVVEPSKRPIDLRDLVERVREQFQVDGIRVEMPRVVVEVDPAHFERVVENLMSNALRHTPDGTNITVRASERDDGIELAVEDEGPGVPDHLKSEIFEPFRQGPSLRPHSPGTGVGLALVARFSELNGGRVWVEDRPGGGASFRVWLPRPAVAVESREVVGAGV